jgi:hypothetical protein
MRTSKEQQQEMASRYSGGESTAKLAQDYGISSEAVRGLLERRGIARRDREHAARKYICNHIFFSSIDSEEKAYWLGFIAADGCISGNELRVCLSPADRDHLVQLGASLNSSHPVTDYTLGKRAYCEFIVCSTQLTRDLIRHGITPRKSFTLQWPTLSAEMFRHFARGYVDGDGCFTADSNVQNNVNVYFSVTSNKPFLLDMQGYLQRHCSLNQTKLFQRHKDSPIYSGKLQVRRIVDFLYHDAIIYLPRKYDKAYRITR